MKTLEREELTFRHRGPEYEIDFTRKEIGTNQEITIVARAEITEPPEVRATFRVTDLAEQVCSFRKVRPERLGEPLDAHLVALSKMGWFCENKEIGQAELPNSDAIPVVLDYVDDILGSVIRMEDSPFRDHPFALDTLEVAQTVIAHVNGAFYGLAEASNQPGVDISEEYAEEFLSRAYSGEGLETGGPASVHLRASYADPHAALALVPLMNYHFGTDYNAADLLSTPVEEIPEDVVGVSDQRSQLGGFIRPGSFATEWIAPTDDEDDYFDSYDKRFVPTPLDDPEIEGFGGGIEGGPGVPQE